MLKDNNLNNNLKLTMFLLIISLLIALMYYVYYLNQLRVNSPCMVCERELNEECQPKINIQTQPYDAIGSFENLTQPTPITKR